MNRTMVERVRKLVEDGERWFSTPGSRRGWVFGGKHPDGEPCILPPHVGEAQIKAIRYLLDRAEGGSDGIRSSRSAGAKDTSAAGRNSRRRQPDGAGS